MSRLVLVDDASPDDTPAVARRLQDRFEGRVVYVRNAHNVKQAESKNRGKALAETPWVYFGDDDSVLEPGSIAALLRTAADRRADIVGAAAVYCAAGETPAKALARYRAGPPARSAADILDLARLRFSFERRAEAPLELDVTQAAFLISREWYTRYAFDPGYRGNGYREETDFLLACRRAGARVVLDGDAVQVNLPGTTGGARAMGRLRYEWYSVVNTARLLRKHRAYFEGELGVPLRLPFATFVGDRLAAAARKLRP